MEATYIAKHKKEVKNVGWKQLTLLNIRKKK